MDVRAIGQEHIGQGASVLAKGLLHDFFPENEGIAKTQGAKGYGVFAHRNPRKKLRYVGVKL